MKKKLLIGLCLFSSTLLLGAGTSMAATGAANNGTGGTLTMGAFTYNSSPSVSIVVFDSDSAYAIMATNIVTDTTNGMEYATTSAATGYAQKTKTTAVNTALSPLSTVDMPSGTWKWMGGS